MQYDFIKSINKYIDYKNEYVVENYGSEYVEPQIKGNLIQTDLLNTLLQIQNHQSLPFEEFKIHDFEYENIEGYNVFAYNASFNGYYALRDVGGAVFLLGLDSNEEIYCAKSLSMFLDLFSALALKNVELKEQFNELSSDEKQSLTNDYVKLTGSVDSQKFIDLITGVASINTDGNSELLD